MPDVDDLARRFPDELERLRAAVQGLPDDARVSSMADGPRF
jgi:hypothetical protein